MGCVGGMGCIGHFVELGAIVGIANDRPRCVGSFGAFHWGGFFSGLQSKCVVFGALGHGPLWIPGFGANGAGHVSVEVNGTIASVGLADAYI